MSDRTPGPGDVPMACPFVAFEDDRERRSTLPDHRHRCYAEPSAAPRALAHQEAYCLTGNFPACPTFQDWARREAARSVASDPHRDVPAGRPEDAVALLGVPQQLGAFDETAQADPLPASGSSTAGSAAGLRTGSVAGAVGSAAALDGDEELAALVRGHRADEVDPPPFLAARPGADRGTSHAAAPRRAVAHQASPRPPADPSAPPWERPRRFEAYPTIRTRTRAGSIPPLLLGLAALAIAALIFFALPGFLAPQTNRSGAGGSATPSASAGASGTPTAAPTTAPPTAQIYIVKAGDTLSGIAKQFGITLAQLQAANPQIKDPNKIAIGDQITIPAPSPSPTVSAAPSPVASGSAAGTAAP